MNKTMIVIISFLIFPLISGLESLDCSLKLKEIFKILFFETYESKIGAFAILSDQIFVFSEEDLFDINQMWEDCKFNPEKCPGYDDHETRELMENAVDGFMSYLKQ